MKRRQKRKHLEIEENKEDDEKAEEISKSQDDVPQPESTRGAEAQNPGVGEVSSASKYFSCVSSPPKLIHRSNGTQNLQDSSKPGLSRDQVSEGQATDATSQPASSSCPSYKTCVSSPCMNRYERGMKIYYMRVHAIKGVAVSWDTSETSESLEKQPRMEEATLPESVWVGAPPSDVSTRNLLSDSEQSGEEKEHEERLELESPPESPVVEERPRAKTPDSLVTIENGYKCMACCRVYTTLDCLQQHVQNGFKEGFSCHVFHLVMSQIIGNVESEHTRQQRADTNKEEKEHKEEKAEERQPTEEDGAKKPWRRRDDYQDSSGSGQNIVSVKEDERTNSQSNT